MTDHIKTRHKIKAIDKISTFEALLNECVLSDTDKEILRLHYIQEKDFCYIADTLGFSEVTIKQRHRKALKKLSSLI